MKILEIYAKYRLPGDLQKHQLRVAGIASIIGRNFADFADANDMLTACLLHDMGNIVKYGFKMPAAIYEPEGIEYWKTVQREVIDKYGPHDQAVTLKIASELGIMERVIELIKSIDLSEQEKTLESADIARKICTYSDNRVTPYDVVTIQQRLDEVKARKLSENSNYDVTTFDESARRIHTLERQIFANINLHPDQITDAAVDLEIKDLENWDI